MGDKLVTAPSPERIPTFTEIFDKCCGYYLSIGMSYTDYWDGDPEMVRFYRDKNKLDIERKNQELWLLGGYIYSALVDVSPAVNALSKKHDPLPYMGKPIELIPPTPEEEKRRRIEESKKATMQLVEAWNAGFMAKKKREKEAKEVKSDGN